MVAFIKTESYELLIILIFMARYAHNNIIMPAIINNSISSGDTSCTKPLF